MRKFPKRALKRGFLDLKPRKNEKNHFFLRFSQKKFGKNLPIKKIALPLQTFSEHN